MIARSTLAISGIALALVGCSPTPGTGADSSRTPQVVSAFPAKAEMLDLIKQRVEQNRATGIVLAVRESDGRHTVVSYGDSGASALPLDAKSVFEIGSISKVFTGVLLAEMAGRGEVAIDDAVQKHAHPGVSIPTHGEAPIRLVNLATHTSGLPRLPANLVPSDNANPYADYSVEQLHAFLSGYSLAHDVGTTQEYSNLGAGLLGHLLANVGGTDWETLVTQRILAPLGMRMSGVTLSPEMRKHLAVGHDAEGKATSNWDLPTLPGAGALRSNAEDMLRFLDANVSSKDTPLHVALRTSHVPRADVGPSMKIGLHWHIKTTSAGPIIWHNGGTGGYRSFIGFDPKRKIGVVVLENSARGSDDIGFHLLDASSPLLEAPKVRTEVIVKPELLAEYVGIYELSPKFHLNVTLIAGVLYTQATNQPKIPVFAESNSEFFAKVIDAQLSFVRDDSGKVTKLVLHQGGSNMPAPRLAGEEAKAAMATIVGKARNEVPVSAKVLASYAGVYELTPTFQLSVDLKDGVLHVQATNQPAFPVYPESDTTFFFKVVDAQIHFVKDAKGAVSKLILHQGGLEQTAKKVK